MSNIGNETEEKITNIKCWEIMHEASPVGNACQTCQAYTDKKNCWEVDNRPCTNSPAVCILINCPVYKGNKESIEHQLINKNAIDEISHVEAVGKKECWTIRQCSAESIESCEVKNSDKDCWEEDGCICHVKQNDGCDSCPIYIYHTQIDSRLTR